MSLDCKANNEQIAGPRAAGQPIGCFDVTGKPEVLQKQLDCSEALIIPYNLDFSSMPINKSVI